MLDGAPTFRGRRWTAGGAVETVSMRAKSNYMSAGPPVPAETALSGQYDANRERYSSTCAPCSVEPSMAARRVSGW